MLVESVPQDSTGTGMHDLGESWRRSTTNSTFLPGDGEGGAVLCFQGGKAPEAGKELLISRKSTRKMCRKTATLIPLTFSPNPLSNLLFTKCQLQMLSCDRQHQH